MVLVNFHILYEMLTGSFSISLQVCTLYMAVIVMFPIQYWFGCNMGSLLDCNFMLMASFCLEL